MNSVEKQIADQDAHWIEANSGHHENRNYLGMSGIADCPLVQYRRFVNGDRVPYSQLLRFRAGYVWEDEAKQRLGTLYRAGSERELVAGFDARYQGHTDGEVLVDGEVMLLEIKSLPDFAFSKLVRDDGGVSVKHFWQVQAYLRHGGYARGVLRYICREDGRTRNVLIERDDAVGQRTDEKARRVLAAIDAWQPPKCECGRCRG